MKPWIIETKHRINYFIPCSSQNINRHGGNCSIYYTMTCTRSTYICSFNSYLNFASKSVPRTSPVGLLPLILPVYFRPGEGPACISSKLSAMLNISESQLCSPFLSRTRLGTRSDCEAGEGELHIFPQWREKRWRTFPSTSSGSTACKFSY